MKSWLKWGLIGAVIGLILSVLVIIITLTILDSMVFILLPQFLLAWAICGENNTICASSVMIVSTTILFFIFGIVIGWIVGKIKSKNTNL